MNNPSNTVAPILSAWSDTLATLASAAGVAQAEADAAVVSAKAALALLTEEAAAITAAFKASTGPLPSCVAMLCREHYAAVKTSALALVFAEREAGHARRAFSELNAGVDFFDGLAISVSVEHAA